MLVLGIESSCDETAAAVVHGRKVLSSAVCSQTLVHEPFGGVVPELASRYHLVAAPSVVRQAVTAAWDVLASLRVQEGTLGTGTHGQYIDIIEQNRNRPLTFADRVSQLNGIAVTSGPGLVGSLMIGLQTAKALSLACSVPVVGVNHLEAHLESVYAESLAPGLQVESSASDSCRQDARQHTGAPPTPHVGLVVSGGHTVLLRVEQRGQYRLMGATRDDAAGEAFDKVAKMLGLGYPGGVVIDRLAKQGEADAIGFPRALPGRNDLDFSFSGLKTAVRLYLERNGVPKSDQGICDFCASVQEAVVEVLVRKATAAVRCAAVDDLVVAGGVAANTRLQEAFHRAAYRDGFVVHIPPAELCTDNAVMVAVAGARRLEEGQTSGLDLDATARWIPSAG